MSADTERHAELAALVALSEQMLERARCGEWDEVPTMAAQRRKGLEAFFASSNAQEDSGFVTSALESILRFDHELIALATASREEAAAKLREIHQGRRAQTAYDSNR
ncbi:MAG: flagellar protein FliT [Thiohalomonadaceae bacterium]